MWPQACIWLQGRGPGLPGGSSRSSGTQGSKSCKEAGLLFSHPSPSPSLTASRVQFLQEILLEWPQGMEAEASFLPSATLCGSRMSSPVGSAHQ